LTCPISSFDLFALLTQRFASYPVPPRFVPYHRFPPLVSLPLFASFLSSALICFSSSLRVQPCLISPRFALRLSTECSRFSSHIVSHCFLPRIALHRFFHRHSIVSRPVSYGVFHQHAIAFPPRLVQVRVLPRTVSQPCLIQTRFNRVSSVIVFNRFSPCLVKLFRFLSTFIRCRFHALIIYSKQFKIESHNK